MACILLLFPSSLFAQQEQPATYAEFEGRHVALVAISTNPQMDTKPFKELIKQKEGTPFSTSEIGESVAALEATGLFSQVQVNVTTEQAGLHVLFILQPAYFVGLLSFPGATQRFLYTELLQAVNIPQQSAYTASLLPHGEEALRHFFERHGYFRAAVHATSETDSAHRIVSLTFQVDLNQEARIGAINLEGVSEEEANDIRRGLRSWWQRLRTRALVPGQKYSDTRVSSSIDYIRSFIRSKGRLAPVVRVASTSFHPETNRVDLNYQIDPGPYYSVRVSGANIRGRSLRRLIPIYEENSIDQDLVAEGQTNLFSYLQLRGYFDPTIHWHLNREDDRADMVYEVNRGARHRVAAIRFEGNQSFSNQQLSAVVVVKKGRRPFFRGRFSDDLDRKSSNAILALYKNQGFANAKVETKIDFRPQANVIFLITEGTQDVVNSINVVGNETESLSSLLGTRQLLHEQPGKPYSPLNVQLDRNMILAAYLNRGYAAADFQPEATPTSGNPHRVDLVYRITEGPRTTISDIILLGNERTKPTFIHRMTTLEGGQPLSAGKLLLAESNLFNLNIFDWASVQPAHPITGQTEAEVVEQVHEEPRTTLDYGGGLEVIPRSGNIPVGEVALPGIPPIGLGSKFETSQESFFGPRGTFDYTRRNFFGRAETFSASTVLSRLDQNVAFSFSNPHFRESSWSTAASLSGERTTQNPIYSAEVAIASLQFQRALNAKRTQTVILQYAFNLTVLTKVTIPDLVPPQDRHVRLSTVSGEYTHDTRDNPLNTHHGQYQVLDFGVTSTPFGSSNDFFRFLGQTTFYFPVSSWLEWANNFRLGLAIPFSGSSVPLSQDFFSGGADSLRGFPINGAGPQRPVKVCSNPAEPSTCTLITVPVGGESLFIFNTEARFRIPNPWLKGLGGVFFYDGGNVYAHVNFSQMINNYTNTIGIGLRYNTPVGPVRFDVGRNLNPIPGLNATQYFVTLGQTF